MYTGNTHSDKTQLSNIFLYVESVLSAGWPFWEKKYTPMGAS
jgi:hypothetical protein